MADPNELLRRVVVGSALAAATVLSLAGEARAQTADATPTPPALDAAREEFQRGVALSQTQRWSEAVEAFRRSRALIDRPRSAFNMALALQHLGRMREARQALHQCLAMPETGADAGLQHDAEALLAAVRAAVGTLYLAVAPPVAEARVDGERQLGDGGTRTLDIDPGRHVVSLAAEGLSTQEFILQVAPGERVVRRVDLATRPARVRVMPSVGDATVSLDDDVVGRGRSVEWTGPPGTHRLRVEAPGYVPQRRPISVGPGESAQVLIELERERTLTRNPWFWTGLGVGVAAAVTVVALLVVSTTDAPDGGTTSQVFQAGRVAW